MAVAYVTHTIGTLTTNGTSMTIAFPSGINEGEDLVLAVVIDGDDATGTTADNSFGSPLEEKFASFGGFSLYAALFHKIAVGTETGNVTITFGGVASDTASAALIVYSGSDNSTTPPTSITTTPASSTTHSAPGDVLETGTFKSVVLCGVDSASNIYSSGPASYTNRFNVGGNSTGTNIYGSDLEVEGDGVTTFGNGTWTISTGATGIAMSIAIKEVVASAGGLAKLSSKLTMGM